MPPQNPDSVKPAVILFSHGSLLCGSGKALEKHRHHLAETGRFSGVEIGYLNYNQPSIEKAVDACRTAGARQIVIAPYFLVSGKFVRTDLPARLEPLLKLNPDLDIRVGRPVEECPPMLPLLERLLKTQYHPGRWQKESVEQARQQCEVRETCPIFGSELCRAPAKEDFQWGPSKWRRVVAALDNGHAISGSGVDISGDYSNKAGRRGLMIILHGSPHPEANEPALALSEKLRQRGNWEFVLVGYLECNEPGVADALDQAAGAGVTHLDVLPYFLHRGRHLVVDIGNELQWAQKRWPKMDVRISPAIGESADLVEVLLYRIEEALGDAGKPTAGNSR